MPRVVIGEEIHSAANCAATPGATGAVAATPAPAPQPAAPAAAPASAAVLAAPTASEKRREVEALYAEHSPEKLADVDKLLAKYGEDRLLSMVRRKYGVGASNDAAPAVGTRLSREQVLHCQRAEEAEMAAR